MFCLIGRFAEKQIDTTLAGELRHLYTVFDAARCIDSMYRATYVSVGYLVVWRASLSCIGPPATCSWRPGAYEELERALTNPPPPIDGAPA